MSEPRRHHFVPRAYLKRFADRDHVFVRRRDGASFRANCVNVAVECGLYDVQDASGNRSTAVESLLGDLDEGASEALRHVDEAKQPPPAGSSERTVLTTYMALQMTRTPEQRERILFPRRLAEYAGDRAISEPLVAKYLEHVHLGFKPSDSEVRAAYEFASVALKEPRVLTREFVIDTMLRSVRRAVPLIDRLHWTLEFSRKARFITSDVPLVLWRAPSPRDNYEGVGIGNADEIRFPLDPSKQLTLTAMKRTPTANVDAARARVCNMSMAEACHRFVISNPAERKQMQGLKLAARRPVLRFNTGPLYETQADRTILYQGEVLHTWVPRR